MKVIDLCSGLGGFSQAFVDAGDEVIRVDIGTKFKNVPHTVIADVMSWEPPFVPDVVLASPPCQAFSFLRYGYERKNGKHPLYEYFVSLAKKCLGYSEVYPSALVIVENPLGRLRHEIGMPTETLDQCMYGRNVRKRTDLWGNYTQWGSLAKLCTHAPHVGHVPSYTTNPGIGLKGPWGVSALAHETSAQRAKIPYALSLAVRELYIGGKQ